MAQDYHSNSKINTSPLSTGAHLSSIVKGNYRNHGTDGIVIPALLFLFVLLFSASHASAQKNLPNVSNSQKVDTLALVNGEPITSEDFRNRFELSLYPGKGNRTYLDQTKHDFLYSMIAEKLLSQAAALSNVSLTPAEEVIKKETEEIFLRDALYRKEIVPRAKVTNDEILHGFKISIYKYMVDAFYFNDSSSAGNFYSLLQRRPKPNIYMLSDSLHVRHDTLEIPYGESSAEIENAFFGHTKGFVSKPAITVDGWVIFRVLSRELNEKFTSGSTPDRLNKIHDILVSREEEKLGYEYLESVMKNVQVDVNYKIFRPLVYAIQKIFEKGNPPSFDPYYSLAPADLLHLSEEFSAELNEPLLSFKGGSLSLERIFQELPVAGFAAEDATIPGITVALHSSLRFISQNYFLAQRARELGLQNSGEVKYNVQMTLDAFRSYRIANDVTDTVKVTQDEVDKYFMSHHDEVLNAVQLKIKMYEANTINEAIAIFNKLNEEKNMPIDPNDTTAVWVNAFRLGEIGAVLAELKDGDIYGPLMDNGKFYIYKLVDKKSKVGNAEIKNSIQVAKEMLLAQRKRRALDRYIADLAQQENVKIFGKNLLNLKVTPIQMFTFRYIGFGGKIAAVPMLYPREGWIKYYQQKRLPQP